MSDAAAVRAMTDEEYARWRAVLLDSYAADMVDAGMLDADAAAVRAAEQHERFLPQEQHTPGMHLLRVLDGRGEPVGVLWVGPHPQKAGAGFVFDVAVDEDRRGGGFGRGAMLAAERIAQHEGWLELGLNVFGPNARARALYDSLGYTVVSTTMSKPLRSADPEI